MFAFVVLDLVFQY